MDIHQLVENQEAVDEAVNLVVAHLQPSDKDQVIYNLLLHIVMDATPVPPARLVHVAEAFNEQGDEDRAAILATVITALYSMFPGPDMNEAVAARNIAECVLGHMISYKN